MSDRGRLWGMGLALWLLLLTGCQVLVVPPDAGPSSEDVNQPPPGPTLVEMTIVLTDGLTGAPLVGSQALLGAQEALTSQAGKATFLVPAGQVFTAALYTSGHRPLYVNGVAAGEAFFWPARSISEEELGAQVLQAGGVLDPTLGIAMVWMEDTASGATANLSAPWVVAFSIDGTGATAPGPTLASGGPGGVVFANIPAGTATVDARDGSGEPCGVLTSGATDSFSLQVEAGACTSVSLLCGASG